MKINTYQLSTMKKVSLYLLVYKMQLRLAIIHNMSDDSKKTEKQKNIFKFRKKAVSQPLKPYSFQEKLKQSSILVFQSQLYYFISVIMRQGNRKKTHNWSNT